MGNRKKSSPQNPPGSGDAKRDGAGRFGPGNRANPGGRPRKVAEVQEYAAAWSFDAIDKLVSIMKGKSAKEARQAAIAILDRAWGKPAQPIAGVPGNPVGIQAGAGVIDMLKKLAGEDKA